MQGLSKLKLKGHLISAKVHTCKQAVKTTYKKHKPKHFSLEKKMRLLLEDED